MIIANIKRAAHQILTIGFEEEQVDFLLVGGRKVVGLDKRSVVPHVSTHNSPQIPVSGSFVV